MECEEDSSGLVPFVDENVAALEEQSFLLEQAADIIIDAHAQEKQEDSSADEDENESAEVTQTSVIDEEEEELPPLSYELQEGWKILDYFMRKADSSLTMHFKYAVDCTYPDTLDYYEKVKEPIWMNMMQDKFKKREYNTITEFVTDFRRMVYNCCSFNGTTHHVSRKADKLLYMLTQKLNLLRHDIRQKTTEDLTTPWLQKQDNQDGLFSFGQRKRNSTYRRDTTSEMRRQLRQEEEEKARVARKQKKEDKTAADQAAQQEMLDWEDTHLTVGPIKSIIQHSWELPQIGLFLHLCRRSLNLEEVPFFELERCLAMPRQSSRLHKIMTSLLSTPFQRSRLDKMKMMPYNVWTQKLDRKLELWYKTLADLQGNVNKAAFKLGLEDRFFQIVGLTNPLTEKSFHNLSFYKKIWILKSVCENLVDSDNDLAKAIENTDIESDQRETLEGTDRHGNVYVHMPQFCGEFLRVYRRRKVVYPTVKVEEVGEEEEKKPSKRSSAKKKLNMDKPSGKQSQCSTPSNDCDVSGTSSPAPSGSRSRGGNSRHSSPMPSSRNSPAPDSAVQDLLAKKGRRTRNSAESVFFSGNLDELLRTKSRRSRGAPKKDATEDPAEAEGSKDASSEVNDSVSTSISSESPSSGIGANSDKVTSGEAAKNSAKKGKTSFVSERDSGGGGAKGGIRRGGKGRRGGTRGSNASEQEHIGHNNKDSQACDSGSAMLPNSGTDSDKPTPTCDIQSDACKGVNASSRSRTRSSSATTTTTTTTTTASTTTPAPSDDTGRSSNTDCPSPNLSAITSAASSSHHGSNASSTDDSLAGSTSSVKGDPAADDSGFVSFLSPKSSGDSQSPNRAGDCSENDRARGFNLGKVKSEGEHSSCVKKEGEEHSSEVKNEGDDSVGVENEGDSSTEVQKGENSVQVKNEGDRSADVKKEGDSSADVKKEGDSSADVKKEGDNSAEVKLEANSSSGVKTEGNDCDSSPAEGGGEGGEGSVVVKQEPDGEKTPGAGQFQPLCKALVDHDFYAGEELIPDPDEFELVVEDLESLDALIKKFSPPDQDEPAPVEFTSERVTKRQAKVKSPVKAAKRWACEEELYVNLCTLKNDMEKHKAKAKFPRYRHKYHAKMKQEFLDFFRQEPKPEDTKEWDTESEANSDDSTGDESASESEEAEEPTQPAVAAAPAVDKKTTPTALTTTTTTTTATLVDESIEEYELDVSSRGRLRKRRLIPNGDPNDPFAKRKKLKKDDAPVAVPTLATTTTTATATAGAQAPATVVLKADGGSSSRVTVVKGVVANEQLLQHMALAKQRLGPGQTVVLGPGGLQIVQCATPQRITGAPTNPQSKVYPVMQKILSGQSLTDARLTPAQPGVQRAKTTVLHNSLPGKTVSSVTLSAPTATPTTVLARAAGPVLGGGVSVRGGQFVMMSGGKPQVIQLKLHESPAKGLLQYQMQGQEGQKSKGVQQTLPVTLTTGTSATASAKAAPSSFSHLLPATTTRHNLNPQGQTQSQQQQGHILTPQGQTQGQIQRHVLTPQGQAQGQIQRHVLAAQGQSQGQQPQQRHILTPQGQTLVQHPQQRHILTSQGQTPGQPQQRHILTTPQGQTQGHPQQRQVVISGAPRPSPAVVSGAAPPPPQGLVGVTPSGQIISPAKLQEILGGVGGTSQVVSPAKLQELLGGVSGSGGVVSPAKLQEILGGVAGSGGVASPVKLQAPGGRAAGVGAVGGKAPVIVNNSSGNRTLLVVAGNPPPKPYSRYGNVTVKRLLEDRRPSRHDDSDSNSSADSGPLQPAVTPPSYTIDVSTDPTGLTQATKPPPSRVIPLGAPTLRLPSASSLDLALQTVVTSVHTTLPTAHIKVPSPTTLPSLSPRRNVTRTVQSNKSPIFTTSKVQTEKKVVTTIVNSGTALTLDPRIVVSSTEAAASSRPGTVVLPLRPGHGQGLAGVVDASAAGGKKQFVVQLVSPGGATPGAGSVTQRIMLPQGVLANLKAATPAGAQTPSSSIDAAALQQLLGNQTLSHHHVPVTTGGHSLGSSSGGGGVIQLPSNNSVQPGGPGLLMSVPPSLPSASASTGTSKLTAEVLKSMLTAKAEGLAPPPSHHPPITIAAAAAASSSSSSVLVSPAGMLGGQVRVSVPRVSPSLRQQQTPRRIVKAPGVVSSGGFSVVSSDGGLTPPQPGGAYVGLPGGGLALLQPGVPVGKGDHSVLDPSSSSSSSSLPVGVQLQSLASAAALAGQGAVGTAAPPHRAPSSSQRVSVSLPAGAQLAGLPPGVSGITLQAPPQAAGSGLHLLAAAGQPAVGVGGQQVLTPGGLQGMRMHLLSQLQQGQQQQQRSMAMVDSKQGVGIEERLLSQQHQQHQQQQQQQSGGVQLCYTVQPARQGQGAPPQTVMAQSSNPTVPPASLVKSQVPSSASKIIMASQAAPVTLFQLNAAAAAPAAGVPTQPVTSPLTSTSSVSQSPRSSSSSPSKFLSMSALPPALRDQFLTEAATTTTTNNNNNNISSLPGSASSVFSSSSSSSQQKCVKRGALTSPQCQPIPPKMARVGGGAVGASGAVLASLSQMVGGGGQGDITLASPASGARLVKVNASSAGGEVKPVSSALHDLAAHIAPGNGVSLGGPGAVSTAPQVSVNMNMAHILQQIAGVAPSSGGPFSVQINTQGLQHINTQGLHQINTQGQQQISTQGLQQINSQGLQQISARGLQQINTHQINTQGLQQINAQGLQQINTHQINAQGLQQINTHQINTQGLQQISAQGLQQINTHQINAQGLQQINTHQINTQGLQQISAQGLQQIINAQGLQQINAQGLQQINAQGLQQISAQGLQQINTQGLQQINTQGLQQINTQGLQQINAHQMTMGGLPQLSAQQGIQQMVPLGEGGAVRQVGGQLLTTANVPITVSNGQVKVLPKATLQMGGQTVTVLSPSSAMIQNVRGGPPASTPTPLLPTQQQQRLSVAGHPGCSPLTLVTTSTPVLKARLEKPVMADSSSSSSLIHSAAAAVPDSSSSRRAAAFSVDAAANGSAPVSYVQSVAAQPAPSSRNGQTLNGQRLSAGDDVEEEAARNLLTLALQL